MAAPIPSLRARISVPSALVPANIAGSMKEEIFQACRKSWRAACDLPVVIGSESLKPGVCYLGEPDGHLTLMDKHLAHLVPGSGYSARSPDLMGLMRRADFARDSRAAQY
jgi:hypothetical protein